MGKYTKRVGGRVMAGQRRKWIVTLIAIVVIVALFVLVAIGIGRIVA